MKVALTVTLEEDGGVYLSERIDGKPASRVLAANRIRTLGFHEAEDASGPDDFAGDRITDSLGEAAAWLASRWMVRMRHLFDPDPDELQDKRKSDA